MSSFQMISTGLCLCSHPGQYEHRSDWLTGVQVTSPHRDSESRLAAVRAPENEFSLKMDKLAVQSMWLIKSY